MSEAQEAHEALADELTGLIRDVVMLHKPDSSYDECRGCDFGGYEGDAPGWPCRTIRLIQEGMGL